MLIFTFFVYLLPFLVHSDEETDVSQNILVLLENVWVKETHSLFLKLLTDRGYSLTIKMADDSSVSLAKYGEYVFGHVIILAPSVSEFGGSLGVKELVKFLDDGGNLIVTASSDVGEAIRQLGSEFGVEFDEPDTAVIDHFNYDVSDDGSHTKLVVPPENLINCSVITGGNVVDPLIFRGIGISSDSSNPLLIPILHGSRTSYSYSQVKSITDYPNSVGTNTQLIVALQARNNARALFTGSIDFFSNVYLSTGAENARIGKKYLHTGNLELTKNLLLWTLGVRGQLRVVSVEHHRVGETSAPSQYTITDDVYYAIRVEEMKDLRNRWVPYEANDLQLEFIRIDPFIRKTMDQKDGLHYTVLRLPDVYGVFKFVVDYNRLGYSHLKSVTQVPVRPFTHTQYERFIEAAYPYYFSAISMVVGVVVFSFVFLYHQDDKEKMD